MFSVKWFTPTGVGTIERRCGVETRAMVHPHGRGDNKREGPRSFSSIGSPPRAWGQWRDRSFSGVLRWFTPTGVGTICRRSLLGCAISVHPHGRGDNAVKTARAKRGRGSPPRAWGQLSVDLTADPPRRFTPTGVGTMPVERRRGWLVAVHPHGRGDNRLSSYLMPAPHGSPPRAWGQW